MLLCVVCWSASGLFIAFIDWHPMVISGIRSGIAALFMILVRGKSMLAWVRGPRKGALLLSAAALASGGTKMLYVLANKLTSPANAIFLHHTAPVWAVVLGWFLAGEKPKRGQWAALALTAGGLALFLAGGLRYRSLAGDGVALAAGACFGAGMVFLRMNREGSPELCLLLSHCLPLGAGIPFIVAYPPEFTPLSAGSVLFLGVVQAGAASLLYAWAIKRLRALDAAFISQLEPVLNPVWIAAVTGRFPGALSLAGGGAVIAAALLNLALAKNSLGGGNPPEG
jgi:drug/metabolite transporter (DMT)-like permease